MANIKSFPNNQDEYIGAEEVMRWLHGRTSGVFGAEGNAAVAAVLDSMAVTVSDGNGWLSNANADGIVWWINNEAANGSKLQLAVDMADAVLPRIDRVVVSWQTTNYVALPEVIVLKGTAASTPVAPELTNNNVLRQISLARINIPAGSTAITADMITDERLDKSVCGIVTDSVAVDTSMVNSQMAALLDRIEKNLTEITDGQILSGSITADKLAENAVSVTFNATALASGWTQNNGYAYQAVNVDGILTTDNPIVDLYGIGMGASAKQTMTEEWGKVYQILNNTGTITFYATEIPEVDLVVKILCIRK